MKFSVQMIMWCVVLVSRIIYFNDNVDLSISISHIFKLYVNSVKKWQFSCWFLYCAALQLVQPKITGAIKDALSVSMFSDSNQVDETQICAY